MNKKHSFRRRVWIFIVSVFAALLAEVGLGEPNWPQFRGPHRNGVATDEGLLKKWPESGPDLVWEAQGAGRGYSSLCIANGTIYTLGDAPSTADDQDEYLVAFNATEGTPLWKTRLGKPWDEGPDDWQSSRSTPTYDDQRLYSLTAHGDLVCVDATNGAVVWSKNLKQDFGGKKGDDWGYGESVLIDGDMLVCTPGGEGNTMVALKKTDGALIWAARREGDRGAGHASIQVSQVGDTKVYVQTTAQGALGVRANDGQLLWSYEIDETVAVIPSPIIRDDLVFFTAGYGRGGALLRQVPQANGVDVEVVYGLNPDLENKHGGVVLVGDHLFGDSGDSGVPFSASFLSGERNWKARGSGRGSAAFAAADGHLYLLFQDSTVVLAPASSDEYEEVGTFKLPTKQASRPTWAHPVITDGKLFLRNDDSIYCYDVKAD